MSKKARRRPSWPEKTSKRARRRNAYKKRPLTTNDLVNWLSNRLRKTDE